MIYRDNSFSSSAHTANLIKSNEIPKHTTKPHKIHLNSTNPAKKI